MKGTTERDREREAILKMPGPFERLVFFRSAELAFGLDTHRAKRSDLSPQETNLMDSAAKMVYLCGEGRGGEGSGD